MKKLKFLLIGAMSLLATSCLVEDEDSANAEGLYDSPNIANFRENTFTEIFTPSSTAKEYSTRVNYITDLPISNTDASFRFEVNTTETTLAATDYEIETSADYTFDIPAGEEVATGWFDYKIFPENIAIGSTNYFVVDLIKVTGSGSTVGGKLFITIEKCDPPLTGDYTIANFVDADDASYSVDGNPVTLAATGCNTYRMNVLPPVANPFWVDLSHDEATDVITITNWQLQGDYPLTGTVTNNAGVISFSGMALEGIGWYNNISWDLMPN